MCRFGYSDLILHDSVRFRVEVAGLLRQFNRLMQFANAYLVFVRAA